MYDYGNFECKMKLKTGVGSKISTWYQSLGGWKVQFGTASEKLQEAIFTLTEPLPQIWKLQFVRIASMSLGLRVEDRLDGQSNYSAWRERIQSIFEDAEV